MEAAGKRYIVHGSRSDVFRLWNLSDIHWMSKACAEEKVRADIAEIRADPYSFWLSGGDLVDFIGHTDRRWDPDSVADWVSVQDLGDLGNVGMRQVAKLLSPIKHKCLGCLLGNHEKQYALHTEHESLHGWLCTELGAPNLQYSAMFDVVFVRQGRTKEPSLLFSLPASKRDQHSSSFRVFVHHGAGYAQTPGGKLNRLVQFMQSFEAEIFFVGHTHDHVARKEPAIGADKPCKKLVERQRIGVVSGSYLKTYSQGTTTYGEQRGYRPTSLGAAVVRVCPETRHLEAVI